MVIHLTGPDSYRSHRRRQQLRQAFRDKFDQHGFNTVTIDGQSATAEDLRTAIQTTGFFSPQRFVAIDDYLAASAVCRPAALLEILQPVIDQKDVVVVIRELIGEVKAKKTKAKKEKKTVAAQTLAIPGAKTEEFPLLTPSQLTAWVLKEAKARGGDIGRPAATELVILCAGDLWRISNELDKLLAYTTPKTITGDDIATMVQSPYASDIFGLLDAIGQRRTAAALHLLHHELQAGTHPLALIATMANHIRTLLAVSSATDVRSPAALATSLGLHPFVVKKALSQTKLFEPQTLRDWHHQLVNIDYQLKTTPLDAETLLDVLLLKEVR